MKSQLLRTDLSPGDDPMVVWAQTSDGRHLDGGKDVHWQDPDGLFAWSVLPGRAARRGGRPAPAAPPGFERPTSTTPVLVGVIDNGCPFAHRALRDGNDRTRVLALWDQDRGAPAFTAVGGVLPGDFGYGCEIGRAALDPLVAGGQDRAYAAADYDVLRERFGHGAGVLGLLAGTTALAGRVAPDPDTPPSWAPAGDEAGRSDLVFVQLPRVAVQDCSSAALPRLLIDGLKYIVSCARPGQRVVVNISEGSSHGLHDGSSAVERSMLEIIDSHRASGGELSIVLPAGNMFDEQRHAEHRLVPGQPARSVLQVQPHCEAPTFVTLRLPKAAAGLRFRLLPPGQAAAAQAWVEAGQVLAWVRAERAAPIAMLVHPGAAERRAGEALVVIAPTRCPDPEAEAPHGRWTLEFECKAAPVAAVHLWISRNQRNATALPRAFQAHFVDIDESYNPARHLRACKEDPPAGRSPIRRSGTLNGLATVAPGRGIVVAGGVLRRPEEAAPYSSAGPAASGGRRAPDATEVTDESWALRGLRVAGNRSGEVVRAIGTSFAAPQLARFLVNGGVLDAPRRGDRRVGAGTPGS